MTSLGGPLITRVDRWLRRWMQNAQGFWPDGHVGRRATLWLPDDGSGGRIVVRGRNLEVAGQVVTIRAGRVTAATDVLAPGATFELVIDAAPAPAPIELSVSCRRVVPVGPLDPALGGRRAGCVIEKPVSPS